MESHQALAVEQVRRDGAGASMSALADVFKALAHPVRAQVLELLSQGASSIPELCAGAGVKASHLSRYLNLLRGQHLIQCRWTSGRLVYSLTYPEVVELLAAARSVLQARTSSAVSSLGTAPEEQQVTAPWGDQHSAQEAALVSRAVIADACQAIAGRTGCTPEAAAGRLITTARTCRIALLEAAMDELSNGQEGSET